MSSPISICSAQPLRAWSENEAAADFDRAADVDDVALERGLAGLDLRQIEHVVDQLEQPAAGGEDLREIDLLLAPSVGARIFLEQGRRSR